MNIYTCGRAIVLAILPVQIFVYLGDSWPGQETWNRVRERRRLGDVLDTSLVRLDESKGDPIYVRGFPAAAASKSGCGRVMLLEAASPDTATFSLIALLLTSGVPSTRQVSSLRVFRYSEDSGRL